MENLRKHRDVELAVTEARKNYLVSEPNYHITIFFFFFFFFSENLLAIEMRKTQIVVNKLVYLGLSILELSKIIMYEFWYDYMKPKHE